MIREAARRALRYVKDRFRQAPFLLAVYRGVYACAPHPVKLRILKQHLPTGRRCVFVETGTFLGDTVAALHRHCKRVISIEIDPALHQLCKERFARAASVDLQLGDCVERLPAVLNTLNQPAVLWLDGHWSGGSTGRGKIDDPIMISLEQIAAHPIKTHTILIDDARCFDGMNGGPDLSEVLCYLKRINPAYRISVQQDIIVAKVIPECEDLSTSAELPDPPASQAVPS